MKRFNVVLLKDDGGVEVYPMKEWLRRHPTAIPAGLDPTFSTSHQLRNALKKSGWRVQESDTEVRLIKPDGSGETPELTNILGAENEDHEDDFAEAPETSFHL